MARCEYYRSETKTLQRNPIRADRRPMPPQRVTIPWCLHAESPVSRTEAMGVLGGGNLLRCGGDLGLCPIAPKPEGDKE